MNRHLSLLSHGVLLTTVLVLGACGGPPAGEESSEGATDVSVASATQVSFYPTPRYHALGSSLSAASTTGCIDWGTRAPFTAVANARLTGAGLTVASVGTGCHITFRFTSTVPALSTAGQAAWNAAGSNPERFAVKTNVATRVVTLAVPDADAALLYALDTALQLVLKQPDGTLVLNGDTEVVDHPSFARRGVVEGFYGPPYSTADRATLLQLMGRLRENVFVYGPKDDPYARDRWREAYPVDVGATIQAGVREADANKVRFVWSISPGVSFDFARFDAELATLKTKIESVRSLGVRHFALFMDDISHNVASDHARLMNAVDDHLKSKDPSARLLVVGTTYSGAPDAYTDTLGRLVHPDVEIMWTGSEVFSPTITPASLGAVNTSLRRRVGIWDNWPQTVDGFTGRSADLFTATEGFYTNPVLNETFGYAPQRPARVLFQALGPIADYLWNPGAYVAQTSFNAWQPRLDVLVPRKPLPPAMLPADNAVVNKDGRIEVLFRATNGSVQTLFQQSVGGSWASAPVSLGGNVAGNPVVAANADGRLQVFVRGTDNRLYTAWQTSLGGAWSTWSAMGSPVSTFDPAVAVNADGRLELFVRGSDGAIWHTWQPTPNGAWGAWASLGGNVASAPAVGRFAGGQLGVFVRGTNGLLYARMQMTASAAFAGWVQLGGGTAFAGTPAVIANEDGRLELFARGQDGRLLHVWQSGDAFGGFGGWQAFAGNAAVASDPAPTLSADGRIEVFVGNTDGSVWHIWQSAPNSPFGAWVSHGGRVTGGLSVVRNLDGRLELFGRGSAGDLQVSRQSSAGGPIGGWTSLGGSLATF
jgi:hypothetical protein